MSASSPIIEDAVAIVPVRDVETSAAFYTGTLGFKLRSITDDKAFAILLHGDAALHLLRSNDEASLQATANHISVYLWVKGLDALYAQFQPKLDKLDEGRVRAPFDQPYGMREFHVKDPDGCLLFFGEEKV